MAFVLIAPPVDSIVGESKRLRSLRSGLARYINSSRHRFLLIRTPEGADIIKHQTIREEREPFKYSFRFRAAARSFRAKTCSEDFFGDVDMWFQYPPFNVIDLAALIRDTKGERHTHNAKTVLSDRECLIQ